MRERRISLCKSLIGGLAVALGFVRPSTAEAWSPYLVVPEPAVAEQSPAFRYANMTDAEAFEELDKRKILYSKVDPVPGVRAPIRLTGRLHGVYVHSSLPPDERVTSIFEILDARLALAIDDFAALLERHDIDEVVHYTMYRPNVAAPDKEGSGHPDAHLAAAAPSPGARRRPPAPLPKAAAPLPKAAAPLPKAAAPLPKAAAPLPKAAAPLPKTAAKGALSLEGKRGAPDGARGAKQKSPANIPEKPVVMVIKRAPEPKKPASARAPTPPPSPAQPPPPPQAASRPSPVAPIRPAAPRAMLHKTTWAPPGTRHPAGLAIDVGALRKRDGRWLNVASHFQGHIGDRTCGEGVSFPPQADANELHAIVCEAHELGLFTYVLTPNYNQAHADHFHMEIKPGVRWFLYH